MKKYLIGVLCISWVAVCSAQDIFWSFDDNQTPLPIPGDCDAKFDETRGGVFMPTMDEMYEHGMAFIKNTSLSVQQQGAYCLLGAALQGHPGAQLEVAKLYEEGRVVAQDDLSAYKWSFIAALNGNKDAEKITLMLEQLLTTADLEKTTGAIQETRMQIQQNLQKKLEEERRQTQEEKQKLDQLNAQNESQTVSESPVTKEVENRIPSPEALQEANSNLNAIFTESDRMK